jgi:hypothetical protein
METSAERKAQNEAIFRDANEEIEARRTELTSTEGKTPFFCECDDPACRDVVRLSVDEYESVRANPATFLIARDHDPSNERVVAEHESYVVVQKEGAARRVAVETDPRTNGG